ncbi:hypothetical protein Agub_g6610 [Astrephomene gubernaculifera]|uniref:Multicopper ferroxidase n=1 Tax=Astrephomene gubernaculifera TaxID=47775 RepID=A0AAD3HLY4_9CHLO|nr:hypothetical protein Agub_g6610 [Astrephomene gubernaculifera]
MASTSQPPEPVAIARAGHVALDLGTADAQSGADACRKEDAAAVAEPHSAKALPGSSSDSGGLEGGSTRRKRALQASIFLVAAIIAVGVGVGVSVGLGKKNNRKSSSSSSGGSSGSSDDVFVTVGELSEPGLTYYIAADQISWNYAPSGRNLCFDNRTAAMLLTPGTTRVGGTFTKAQYREYTDASFMTLRTREADWEHLGNLGPVMFGAVGDVIRIVFRNNLPFAANMVPTGGLVAWDSPTDSNLRSTRTAAVEPGGTTVYYWHVTADAGPVNGSSVTSRMWMYRSGVDPVAHDNAGLLGVVIVAAPESAGETDRRARDVDRELVLLFQVVSERSSALLPYDTDPTLTAGVSYSKMAINGYTYCNMPLSAVQMRVGQRVRWHVASVGSSDSLHNYHWHGHTLELNGHHVDQFTAIPGAAYSANMQLDQPGNWMVHCHVNFHMDGGMVNLYSVVGDPAPFPSLPGARERVYYVAAEEVEWSYTGENNTYACGPEPIPYDVIASDSSPEGNQFVSGPSRDPVRLGPKLTKTLFREYTDANFTTLKQRSLADSYLGLVGPIMRAAVGDNITVVLLNRASMSVSMHPHGLRYDKANEGTLYEDGTPDAEKQDDIVQPGQIYTYHWMVPDRAGPGPKDPSSMLWMYHSHLNETAQTYAGLVGGVIVTGRDYVDANATEPRPNDVDREVVIFFNVVNETKSSNLQYNLATKLGDGGRLAAQMAANSTFATQITTDAGFQEHMLKHGINGYMYCNMPRLTFLQGDKVRLHVMVVGSVEDMHTPNLGGARFDYNRQSSDAVQISPGGMISADVSMSSPGEFDLTCRVADHVASGMHAKYSVLPNPAAAATQLSGVTRTYYIQAEPEEWDYAPDGYQRCTDTDLSYYSNTFLLSSFDTTDSKYRKAVYREYTDATFTVRKSAPAYYGTMGPMIVVEVGDQLVIHFRNNLTDLPDYPVNLSPGGGLVRVNDASSSSSSGGEVACGTAVAAGQTCVYRWVVPDTAGPSADDFNTAVYSYTSTAVDLVAAPSAGLVGALVVAGRGELQQPASSNNSSSSAAATLLPKGVDLMVPLFWQVVDESLSPYYDVNLAADGIDMALVESEDMFEASLTESNMMHSINGFVYCNMPHVVAKSGSVVRWVMVAYGTEGDFHAPYFGGQAVQVDRTGFSTLASLMPSISRAADMRAGDPGTWLLYCDIHDHFLSGMVAQFVVEQ